MKVMNHATQQVPQSSFVVQDQRFDTLVIATKLFDPFNWVEENQVTLFDLALLRGFEFNRYIGYDGKNHRFFIVSKREVSSQLKAISREFFIKNSWMIEESSLPNPTKYLLKQGLWI